MKRLLGLVFAFGVGVVVGTAGSDDSLLEEARRQESSAYRRGYVEALAKFHGMAFQAGFGKWEFDPHTGRNDRFVWVLHRNTDGKVLDELTATAVGDRGRWTSDSP